MFQKLLLIIILIILIILIVLIVYNIYSISLKSSHIELSPKLNEKDIINLKKGQTKMTNMLYEFDKICMKHNITYFAIGGTLLCAIIYKGWIPWDGDIDIEILESDWSRLNKALKEELPKSMFLQTEETDVHYKSWNPKYVMGKIRDINSCYKNCQDGKRFHNGFMIDLNLFYIDNNDILVFPHKADNEASLTKNDVYPLKRVKFDNIMINIPNNGEKYLKGRYKPKNSKYMLPIKDRYPHEGLLDPNNTCEHHYELYPKLYPNN
tara:strand:+ start:865 stop:1659 length:795 start_codon:yes stop_codon:yes gene_type:complete